ncbi:hypothetical protein MUP46_03435 [Patescibacteria group bacterium]|nr:hypothetical protein [Patescibacteria group bacterium]
MTEILVKGKTPEVNIALQAESIMKERTPSPEQVIYEPTIEFLDAGGLLTREERGRVIAMGDRTAISYRNLSEQVLKDREKPEKTSDFYLMYALAARSSNEIAHTSILEQINVGPEQFGGDPPIVMEGISILSGLRDVCSLRHFGFEAFSSRGGIFPEGYWRIPAQLGATPIGNELALMNREIYAIYLDLTKRGVEHFLQTLKPNEGETLPRFRWRVLSHSLDEARQVTNGTFLNHLSMHPNSALALREAIVQLASSEFPEAREIADRLRILAQKGLPTLMRHTELSEYQMGLAEKRRKIAEHLGLTKKDANNAKVAEKSMMLGAKATDNSEEVFLAAFLADGGDVSLAEAYIKVKELSPEEKASHIAEIFAGIGLHDKPPRQLEMIRITGMFEMSLGAIYEAIRHRLLTHLVSRLTIRRGHTTPELYHKLGITDEYEEGINLNEKQYRLVESLGPSYDIFKDYFVARGHIIPYTFKISGLDVFHFLKVRASNGAHPDISGPAFELESLLRMNHPAVFNHLVKKS